jgi:hypothetical protein
MTPYPDPDCVFPLCGGTPERVPLRAPRLTSLVKLSLAKLNEAPAIGAVPGHLGLKLDPLAADEAKHIPRCH